MGEIGGTWNFKCNFCGESRNGIYSRVKAHLLQVKGQGIVICKKVTWQENWNDEGGRRVWKEKKGVES